MLLFGTGIAFAAVNILADRQDIISTDFALFGVVLGVGCALIGVITRNRK